MTEIERSNNHFNDCNISKLQSARYNPSIKEMFRDRYNVNLGEIWQAAIADRYMMTPSESQHRTSQYIRSTKVILRTGLFWMNRTMCRVRPTEASPIEMTHKVISILITSIVTQNIKQNIRSVYFHCTFRLKIIGKKENQLNKKPLQISVFLYIQSFL